MKKLMSFLIKILKKILLGIFLLWLFLLLFVLVFPLTENIGSYTVREMSHEDAWVFKQPEPPDWGVVDLNFDPKDWNMPVIWAPQK